MMIKTRNNINGILLIDKPGLLSSNTVLQRVKFLFHAKKAGHMGCLDPLATGMLPICFGEATKFAQYGLEADKCYAVTACFGKTTNTGDAEGVVTKVTTHRLILPDDVLQQLPSFMGHSLQIPPMYSALKYQGKKLYELARVGQEVPRQPRPIHIYEFSMSQFNYPFAEFIVRCSKGTYIRTLIEDLGNVLGVGAHITQLRRLYTAGFEEQRMLSLEECAAMSTEELLRQLLPMDILLDHLTTLRLSDLDLEKLYLGQALALQQHPAAGLIRLYNEQSKFQGLGLWDPTMATLNPKRLLANSKC